MGCWVGGSIKCPTGKKENGVYQMGDYVHREEKVLPSCDLHRAGWRVEESKERILFLWSETVIGPFDVQIPRLAFSYLSTYGMKNKLIWNS